MGSIKVGSIWLFVFTDDHPPPHAHGFYAGIEVIVEFVDGKAIIARRSNPIVPANAKRSDVRKILGAAQLHAETLLRMWREIHA